MPLVPPALPTLGAPLLVAVLVLVSGPDGSGPPDPAAPTRATGPPSGTPSSTPSGAVWPLRPAPEVVAAFAPPATRYGPGHRGVDLAARPGQVVRAARTGIVTYAGRLAGRGVVVVAHGDTRTTYEPVSAGVSPGDRVSAGSPLGTVERFGSHCWPASCLHWGLLRGEVYLDPLTLVGAGPVRLLPWTGVAPPGGRVP